MEALSKRIDNTPMLETPFSSEPKKWSDGNFLMEKGPTESARQCFKKIRFILDKYTLSMIFCLPIQKKVHYPV